MLSSYYSQKFLKLSGILIKDIYDNNATTIIEIQMQDNYYGIFKLLEKKFRKIFQITEESISKDLADDQKCQVNFMLYASDKLANAYILKETFYDFMESEDYETAKERLQIWILFAENSNLQRFVDVAKTMMNWQKGILNSFTTPYTNAYGYGYRHFNRFRNRILHMCSKESS